MLAQGDIPDRSAAGFGLIETLLWTAGEGYGLLDAHLDRLIRSADALGFACDGAAVRARLAGLVAMPEAPLLRVRLVLMRDGGCTVSAVPTEAVAPGTVWRAVPAQSRFASSDPLLRHKTTRRDHLERELAAAVARGADEVVFVNERDEICEGARANLFLAADGMLLTPALACGLLPGTLRATLLAQGRAREAVLRLADIAAPAEWYLGNSVRGLVRAELLTE
jgi:4-amino-4-deoxychorismate lyase